MALFGLGICYATQFGAGSGYMSGQRATSAEREVKETGVVIYEAA